MTVQVIQVAANALVVVSVLTMLLMVYRERWAARAAVRHAVIAWHGIDQVARAIEAEDHDASVDALRNLMQQAAYETQCQAANYWSPWRWWRMPPSFDEDGFRVRAPLP